jgi:hypothetical protein
MPRADHLSNELRQRPRVAVLSAAAGLLLFGGAIVQAAGAQPKVNELTVQLLVTDKRGALEIIGSLVNALGLLGLAVTLAFLFRAVRARRPETSQGLWIVAVVGAVLAALGGLAYGVLITEKAHQFATHGTQTYPQADALLSSGAVTLLQYGGLLGSLLLSVGFVLVSLNAMRVGLLTRFLGYLGIAAAAASLLLIGSAPALLIEVAWLLAVGYLLIGRWPNGDPPAWRTGEAVPWPSGAEQREQRQRAGGRGGQGAKPGRQSNGKPVDPVVAAGSGTRATTQKRKRKRRS